MKQALTFGLLFLTAAATGLVRFGWLKSNPSIWLDVVFLLSAAACVAAVIMVLLRKMQRSTQETLRRQARSLRQSDDRGR